jgi:adenine-specific DNA-methyltransferase
MPDHSASLDWDTARDILIEGENLQVLKILKHSYASRVKLIYIEPPYNAGDTFVIRTTSPFLKVYMEATGQVDEQGNATTGKA